MFIEEQVVIHSGFHLLKDVSTVLVHMSGKRDTEQDVAQMQAMVIAALEVGLEMHGQLPMPRVA
jgi:hypothetical protein